MMCIVRVCGGCNFEVCSIRQWYVERNAFYKGILQL